MMYVKRVKLFLDEVYMMSFKLSIAAIVGAICFGHLHRRQPAL